MDTNVSDIKTLEKSLNDYEAQMAQVKLAILTASSVTEKDELVSLQSSLEQLIELTKETVSKLHSTSSNSSEETMLVDKFDDEYALFKAELEAFNNSNEKLTEKDEQKPDDSRSVGEFMDSKHFLDDLNSLKGMKCQAPHSNSYDGISYHNAIICDVNVYDIVQSIDQIQVRVLFVNPTHRDMLPCPKYFEGTCQYLDYACWYSHGEIVQFSDLKEYREPNFDSVNQGCKALVKDIDELWHHATVENNCGDNKWEVRFLTNGKTKVVDLQHILPLGSPDEVDDSSSDSEDSSEYEEAGRQVVNDLSALVNKYSMNVPLSVPVGKKFHSKPMDSLQMAKIGNHSATGPRKFWDGMMEPIESAIYPREKTLGNHHEVETSGSESSSEDEEPGPPAVRDVSALVNKSLMNKPLSSALGKWECHTKGIGSRLMAKMGYVTGTGLGKYGDGRLEPVEAVILPVGKSLDHCMNLKEQAGGNLNVSRPNRKLKHLKKSYELKRLKVHNEKKQDMFDFLNKNLGSDKGKLLPHNELTVSKRNTIPLKLQTNQNLKVEGFRISESIRRTEREMEKIQESLSRHLGDSPAHSSLLKKFKDTQKELDKLKSSASAIDTECNKRKDCEKLSVF